ncbi:fumarylacetoacetate hydrolase family protein [Sphingomonas sp. MMS24-J13]|uniref:fumarylacetoacetate hydrolase family protein n=1 Tax=Sphingomonas sp. MMS24-J13 TaxID=3238686 RepID=UPI00384F97C3
MMKLATIRHEGVECAAIVDPAAGRAWPLPGRSMLELIDSGEAPAADGPGVPLDEVALLAPIPLPRRNIFCVGKNYRDHIAEMRVGAEAPPEYPILFSKVPQTVIAPGDAIRIPTGVSEAIDYEAELAVVIGTQGRGIKAADAWGHIFGYTILNDVTARDLQRRHTQWLIGKSLDSFCPMGPWIVTAEALDAKAIDVALWVNGEQRQKANTSDLIFDIPTIIETLSAGITLYPGDIIATGTPAGVGAGFKPPRFLKAGDEVVIEIEGIGRLNNPVQ